MQRATIDRRLTALEAQHKQRVDELYRRWFAEVERVLAADYDRWLDLLIGGPEAIRAAAHEWHGYETRVDADPRAGPLRVEIYAIDPAGWRDIECEVCHE